MKPSSKSPRAEAQVDWANIQSLLLVRLRSIGDTVLMTPCLAALKAARPDLRVAVLLEEMAAPLLIGHPSVDQLITLDRGLNRWRDGVERVRFVQRLRRHRFELAVNLHGGTTSTFLTYASGASLRAGYSAYQYGFLLNRRAPPPEEIWGKRQIHSVEQQLGLLKWLGLPIDHLPTTSLRPSEAAFANLARRLTRVGLRGGFALIHPAATHENKRWSSTKFAQVVKHLSHRYGLPSAIVSAPYEGHILDAVKGFAGSAAYPFTDLSVPELVALSSMARVFIGNDSGPAHIAAAMNCPTVVIFGASNPGVWRPWGDVPHVIVRAETDLAGHTLSPEQRIHHVTVNSVTAAVDHLMEGPLEEVSSAGNRSEPDLEQAQ